MLRDATSSHVIYSKNSWKVDGVTFSLIQEILNP